MPNIPEQATRFSEQVENIFRIIKHGRREQVLFMAFFLCVGLANFRFLLPDVLTNILLTDFLQKDVLPWLNVVAIVPFIWGIVRVWKKAIPPKIDLTAAAKPSAIKGPFAFGEMDGEIFSQLGRETDLSKLLGWVLDSQICFTALKGESGAGKTSLLRAGLVYTLLREKEKYGVTPIYWEASPENPAEELLRAIRLACPEEKDRLRKLDDVVEKDSATKKGIIIDQAEQLSPAKQGELFEAFRKIVARKPPYASTWIIAFREEYASTWFDFETTIPDFHPPKHSLKTFSEAQARNIMAVLARVSGLAPDAAVLNEMVNAMSDGGKVSPVEIGIGMMVLCELYRGPGSEVSLGKFQDAGGVAGLLRAYIKGKLDEGMPEHEHSPMQSALLDMIDPDISHQRLSQGKSAPELAKTAQLPLNRMEHNLHFLASPAVPGAMYRLAHERLIPALESLSGELLTAAAEARQLLKERFRTWSNARRRRFLLSGKDLREVLKYRSHFKDDINPELGQYIRKSRKKRSVNIALGGFILLALLLWQPFNNKVIEPSQRNRRLQSVEAQLVKVKEGIFEMGDFQEEGGDNELPVHPVKLDSFQISRYEITNQQYCDFLNSLQPDDSLKVKLEDEDKWLYLTYEIRYIGGKFVVPDESKRDHPVVTVSWLGAAAFCNFMSERKGKGYKPCYNLEDGSCDSLAKGFRLPTEAEWEYACRAGTTTPFHTGNNLTTDQANYNGNYPYRDNPEGVYLEGTTPVGSYPPNAWGLYDMHGNVWEWCHDWYGSEYYETCKQQGVKENPRGPDTGSYRVLRGGGWRSGAQNCRSAFRNLASPGYRTGNVGFRLVFVP